MNKLDIQKNDIVEFANGNKAQVGINSLWIIQNYYDDKLNCIKKPEYNIVKIYRPTYEVIYEKEEYEQLSLY